MNFFDHSVSIYSKIRDIRERLRKLKEGEGLGIDEWLKSLRFGLWYERISAL